MIPVLVLFGATATGKTAALGALARAMAERRVTFEVISADSRQVYRGLDIGTAKPPRWERKDLPHHLIDIIDPRQPFDVGSFVSACDELVAGIRARRAVPVISGGTAFYLQGFLCGLPETPRASEQVREELRDRLEREGIVSLRRELKDVDPVSEGKIGANDQYRVLRALEVYHGTGRPRSAYAEPRAIRPGLGALAIGLYRERQELYRRINARVETMFAAGLAREVADLYAQGYRPEDPGMRTIGYREFFEFAGAPPWDDRALDSVRERIAGNTRRYARRQELFFRRLPGVRWIEADRLDELVRMMEAALNVL